MRSASEIESSRRGAPTRRRGVEIAATCAAGGAAGIAAAALGIAAGGDPVESFRLAARYTARVSFAAFLPIFLAAARSRARRVQRPAALDAPPL